MADRRGAYSKGALIQGGLGGGGGLIRGFTVVYNTNVNNARIHASYMLGSTIRKTTQHLCVIPYAMYRPPNVQKT